MPTQIGTHFWATCKKRLSSYIYFPSPVPCSPAARAERIDYKIFCHYFVVCFLSFFFSFCFFSLPEMVNEVVYLWNLTHDYSIMQAERQLSRIPWSVHIIYSLKWKCEVFCTFAGVYFLHESAPLESNNLRLKFHFSNNHGQS